MRSHDHPSAVSHQTTHLTRDLLALFLWALFGALVALTAGGCASTPRQLAIQQGAVQRQAAVELLRAAKVLNGQGADATKWMTDAEYATALAAYTEVRTASEYLKAAIDRMGPTDPTTDEVLLYQAAVAFYVNDLRKPVWAAFERQRQKGGP